MLYANGVLQTSTAVCRFMVGLTFEGWSERVIIGCGHVLFRAWSLSCRFTIRLTVEYKPTACPVSDKLCLYRKQGVGLLITIQFLGLMAFLTCDCV